MKAKYLIQWEEAECQDECHYDSNHAIVKILSDDELNEFVEDKDKVKVTFMCNIIPDNHPFGWQEKAYPYGSEPEWVKHPGNSSEH